MLVFKNYALTTMTFYFSMNKTMSSRQSTSILVYLKLLIFLTFFEGFKLIFSNGSRNMEPQIFLLELNSHFWIFSQ